LGLLIQIKEPAPALCEYSVVLFIRSLTVAGCGNLLLQERRPCM